VDIIFFTVFLFTLAKGWMTYLYCAVFGASRLLGGQGHKPYVVAVLAGVLLMTVFYMPSDDEIDGYLKILGTMGQYFAFVFPLILLAFVSLFRRFAKET
jgi:hypothetical protein